MRHWIQPLDIVRIDSGAVGLVTEGDESHCAIAWFGGSQSGESKSAWWYAGEQGLRVIDSLPAFLANCVRHSFSTDINPFEDSLKRRLGKAKRNETEGGDEHWRR